MRACAHVLLHTYQGRLLAQGMLLVLLLWEAHHMQQQLQPQGLDQGLMQEASLYQGEACQGSLRVQERGRGDGRVRLVREHLCFCMCSV
mgnify:CR=1 FL=1